MPAHQLNNSGGKRKGQLREEEKNTGDWGLKTGDWRPGPGSLGQTNRQNDRQNDGHFLPPLQTSQSRTRVYNPRTERITIPGRKYILTCLVQGKKNDSPIELGD